MTKKGGVWTRIVWDFKKKGGFILKIGVPWRTGYRLAIFAGQAEKWVFLEQQGIKNKLFFK